MLPRRTATSLSEEDPKKEVLHIRVDRRGHGKQKNMVPVPHILYIEDKGFYKKVTQDRTRE